ncbi:MAG TPA: glycogen/starch synthase [Candidatus Limnocylindrales bacterium]
MRVLIVASELAGIASVGGVGEYVLGLARALGLRGHDVKVAMPDYGFVDSDWTRRGRGDPRRFPVRLGGGWREICTIRRITLAEAEQSPSLEVVLLGAHPHFASVSNPEQAYRWANHEPWVSFSRAIIDLLGIWDWQPDVIHCHDAHAALVPVYVSRMRREGTGPEHVRTARTVLTIHSLLNQGKGDRQLLAYAGLPESLFAEAFECYGSMNCFKAGLLAADMTNAVSPTFAMQICVSREIGCGLEGILEDLKSQGRLAGLLSGIDLSRWQVDGVKYEGDVQDLETIVRHKRSVRAESFKAWGWGSSPKPVFAFRGRWDNQKGVTLFDKELLDLGRMVLVTTGSPGEDEGLRSQWNRLREWSSRYPQDLTISPPELAGAAGASKHYAMADFLLAPSQSESCGLAVMECQRFGTVPIVRAIGGLVDTVSEAKSALAPNGFTFDDLASRALLDAAARATEVFGQPDAMNTYIRNCLRQDNGWGSRVGQYETLYSRG